MVKVSIGVPVYNVDMYLRQCLESIKQQSFQDFEVIMVDDGSTDNSFEICQECVSKDERFKLYHQENKGLAGARNTCLKYMEGEYVNWIDSDDVIKTDYLKRLLEVQTITQADIVNCLYYSITKERDIYYDLRPISPNLEILEVSVQEIILNFINNKYFIAPMWGSLIKSQLYKGVYFPQGLLYEDNGTKYKLYMQANKIAIMPEALYGYRKSENSITRKATSDKLEKELDRLKKDIICNREKFLYYIEVANIRVEEIHKEYLRNLDGHIAVSRLSERDKQKYTQFIKNYERKLLQCWQ